MGFESKRNTKPSWEPGDADGTVGCCKAHPYWYFVLFRWAYEKFRPYWLGFCGKIVNGLMASLCFNMLENYSDARQMPEPHAYLRMCHHGKLSLTKVTGRAAEGGTVNCRWFLPLVSVAKWWSQELACQKKRSSENTALFWLRKADNWAVTKETCFLLGFFFFSFCKRKHKMCYFIPSPFYNFLFFCTDKLICISTEFIMPPFYCKPLTENLFIQKKKKNPVIFSHVNKLMEFGLRV